MKVLVDENLPLVLAKALNELASPEGDEIRHVYEIAEPGTPDCELFKIAHELRFRIHITHDNHQRKHLERTTIASTGLTVYVLAKAWNAHKFWPKALQLIKWWPLISKHAQKRKPAIYKVPWNVSKSGKFQQLTK